MNAKTYSVEFRDEFFSRTCDATIPATLKVVRDDDGRVEMTFFPEEKGARYEAESLAYWLGVISQEAR